jgi:hypothetical protein
MLIAKAHFHCSAIHLGKGSNMTRLPGGAIAIDLNLAFHLGLPDALYARENWLDVLVQ